MLGSFPLHEKLCSLKSTLTALFGTHTLGCMLEPWLFSQSLLQLREGYFWQSLSYPFPCTLALTAVLIVPALSKYLGRVWRKQISELWTRVACNCSLFKCNYPGSVFSLHFALWAVRNHVFILLGASCPSEVQMEGCFPPSTPSCRSWCCLSSCCLSLIFTKRLHWENSSFKGTVVLYTAHCSLSMDFIVREQWNSLCGCIEGPFLARMLLMEKWIMFQISVSSANLCNKNQQRINS